MAREQGTFTQSANYEIQKEGTIDARQFVDVFADLLAFTASNYIADGFPVTVRQDSTIGGTTYKRGWYQYTGGALNDAANWEYMGGSGLELGETETTAYRGDRGKIAYDHSQASHAPANAEPNDPDTTVMGMEFNLADKLLQLNNSGEIPDELIREKSLLNSKLSDVPAKTIKGNNGIALASPEDLTATEVREILELKEPSDGADQRKITTSSELLDSDHEKTLIFDGTGITFTLKPVTASPALRNKLEVFLWNKSKTQTVNLAHEALSGGWEVEGEMFLYPEETALIIRDGSEIKLTIV